MTILIILLTKKNYGKLKMNFKSAIILCGGKGTRLGTLGKKIPKTLVEINKRPIIWYIIYSLLRNSINHLILPLGYKGEMIKKYLVKTGLINKKDIKIDIINTGINTPIAKRIFKASKYIKSKNFLLLNGDAIFDFNIKNFFKSHKKNRNKATFISCHAPLNYGVIVTKKKKIVNFIRDIEINKVGSSKKKNYVSYIFSGMIILNKSILNLNFKNFDNFEKKLYPILIKSKKTGFSDIQNGFWHSVDSVKDLIRLNKEYNPKKNMQVKKLLQKNLKYEKIIKSS